jgi:hypothetical protein
MVNARSRDMSEPLIESQEVDFMDDAYALEVDKTGARSVRLSAWQMYAAARRDLVIGSVCSLLVVEFALFLLRATVGFPDCTLLCILDHLCFLHACIQLFLYAAYRTVVWEMKGADVTTVQLTIE